MKTDLSQVYIFSSSSVRPHTSHSQRTVTTKAQQVVRKFQVEQKIFQDLLEMKKYQIRVGKSNEAVLVKRLIKNFNKVRPRTLQT